MLVVATSILERSLAREREFPTWARWLALEATVPVVLLASAAIVIGLHWDIAWHRSIGRDTFWSPPHVLEQVASALAGLLCGWRVIYTSFLGPDSLRATAVRWWGIFYGPLGGWICIWGALALVTSAPFDNWWHAAYGLDVKILSPPHVLLLLGMLTLQLGAMVMMLSEQNRARAAEGDRKSVLLAVSMGFIVLMAATIVYEDTGIPNLHHTTKFYAIYGAIFPIFLVSISRAGTYRWPATTAAVVHTVLMIVLNWVLVLIPAEPRLAPIYNRVTHLVPPGFPVLIVLPALVIDTLLRRGPRGDWRLSGLLGPAFVLALFVVQWPFASFLLSLEQPNHLFGTGYWDYNIRIGSWTTQFIDVPGYQWVRGVGPVGKLDVLALARGLLVASIFGMAASRVGLWWGNWMAKVQR